MHCPDFLKNLYLLLLCCITAFATQGQNITNMQIGVSPLELTLLKFNSPITLYEFKNKNSYICQEQADVNALVIKTAADTATVTKLTVTEGSRTHSFTVVCLPAVDFNKISLIYDFSDLKRLKKLVDGLNQGTKPNIIPDQRVPAYTTNTPPDKEAIARRVKDSAAAVKTIKAQTRKNERLAGAKADTVKANGRKDKEGMKQDSAKSQKHETAVTPTGEKPKPEPPSASPKFYTQAALWLKYHTKYPKLVFDLPPEDQYLAGDYAIDRDTLENAKVSYLILKEQPKIHQYSNTVNNINFLLQGIYFIGANCYLRILIRNKSGDDYMVGPMNVKWYRDSGVALNAYPCFITSYPSRGIWTSFPVMPTGSETTLVLTTRALNVKENESLSLTIGDRLKKVNLQLFITGKEYLTIMDSTKSP